jgi:hypothetical protein
VFVYRQQCKEGGTDFAADVCAAAVVKANDDETIVW